MHDALHQQLEYVLITATVCVDCWWVGKPYNKHPKKDLHYKIPAYSSSPCGKGLRFRVSG